MFGTLILMSAAVAGASPVEVSAPRTDWVDVAYDDLRAGRNQSAIARIKGNAAIDANDPSAMINLGAAHARVGKVEEARTYYLAAIASKDRYDVQLSDGRWMDSRRAARLAIKTQQGGGAFALK